MVRQAPGHSRLTLGLYNSYNPTKFMEAHRRAMCRAGALSQGFDCNLVFFGFPVPQEYRTPLEVTEWVISDTSIGNDGDNFLSVTKAGRVSLCEYPSKGFPPQFGTPVATTCRPDPGKGISWPEAVKLLEGESVLLLFGLGPKGLPREAREACRIHLDITGKGSSLETCTAMGAVTAVLALELARAREARGAAGPALQAGAR